MLTLGIPWLGWLAELLDGMLLAVCGWLRLDELLLDEALDWEGELAEDCEGDGWAGGCDCVCWLLQPAIKAPNTTIDVNVRQAVPLCACLCTAFRSVIVSLLNVPPLLLRRGFAVAVALGIHSLGCVARILVRQQRLFAVCFWRVVWRQISREPLINSREPNGRFRGAQAIGRIFRKRTSTSL
ncbi:hypothetical protein [Microbulbifer thermotolerans]|uniref:hypothetical protein n=1 Tax=Microbulbifer thermotolerans TaxID=252514 RepID=UPI0022489FE8|nr:hypothetical protein [Microbulbifer thermotolerans]MCX2779463.1 hypothetical protein [Microbulbifer thermotolerans]MCX2806092.1 hypothetical protein [Microbulbifer thermotolerans]MCX2832417.1 hypothetical protein [Microbulbifer thermotolerans]MCX2836020.1 hypothetical protein [Microbulbifer thermotolerans]WKT61191.1 hypothetical protein Q2E61_03080 [Microbulbifer thermotolerans]